jgi:hypothetical protein
MNRFEIIDLFKSLVNDVRVLEMVVGEEVELVEEVPDVYAGKRIHLRERQNTGDAGIISS